MADESAQRSNLDSGKGLRCDHRVDIVNYFGEFLNDWKAVDLEIQQQRKAG